MPEPPPGGYRLPEGSVARLADRVVDPRRAAVGYAVAACLLAASAWPVVDHLFDTTNARPGGLEWLAEAADPAAAGALARRGVVVVVDGLRLDEARAMRSLRLLRQDGVAGRVLLDLPTLSRAFYHALFTAVPQAGTGVRTNRFTGRARLDTLPARVRAAGGRVAWITQQLDWMPAMLGADADAVEIEEGSFEEPLHRWLAGPDRADLAVVHHVRVDQTAHASGTRSDAHRDALAEADRLVRRVMAKTRDAALLVVSDHGHREVGGHGGDETEVRYAPFALRAPGLAASTADPLLRTAELAPTLAAWMGVPAPRSAVSAAAPALAPPGYAPPGRAEARATAVRAAVEGHAHARRSARVRGSIAWLLLSIMALGATKRSFGGLDRSLLLAPLVLVAVVLAVHLWVWQRPLSLSALDEVTRQGARLGALGLVAGLLSSFAGASASRARDRVARLRRGAAATVWSAGVLGALSVVWNGGALGPWELSAFEIYLPVVGLATMGGACIAGAVVLLVSRRLDRPVPSSSR